MARRPRCPPYPPTAAGSSRGGGGEEGRTSRPAVVLGQGHRSARLRGSVRGHTRGGRGKRQGTVVLENVDLEYVRGPFLDEGRTPWGNPIRWPHPSPPSPPTRRQQRSVFLLVAGVWKWLQRRTPPAPPAATALKRVGRGINDQGDRHEKAVDPRRRARQPALRSTQQPSTLPMSRAVMAADARPSSPPRLLVAPVRPGLSRGARGGLGGGGGCDG